MFDQKEWPGHSSYSGATSFSISTDAFKHAIQTYASELQGSLLQQQFEAMQEAHKSNQPLCGFTRIAIDIEQFNNGYIHTHGDFDNGLYVACSVSTDGNSSVGTQFAGGDLMEKPTGDSRDDTFYGPTQTTDMQIAPNNAIYAIPPKTPHGPPKSGGRIFMRLSGEPPFSFGEWLTSRCLSQLFQHYLIDKQELSSPRLET